MCYETVSYHGRIADDLLHERAKNKMLQEEMEATLHDIQNMWRKRTDAR